MLTEHTCMVKGRKNMMQRPGVNARQLATFYKVDGHKPVELGVEEGGQRPEPPHQY